MRTGTVTLSHWEDDHGILTHTYELSEALQAPRFVPIASTAHVDEWSLKLGKLLARLESIPRVRQAEYEVQRKGNRRLLALTLVIDNLDESNPVPEVEDSMLVQLQRWADFEFGERASMAPA